MTAPGGLTSAEIAAWRDLIAAARSFAIAATVANAERVSHGAVKAYKTPYPPGDVAAFRPLIQLGLGLAGRPEAERKDRQAALQFAADRVAEALDALPPPPAPPAPPPPAGDPPEPWWLGGGL